MPKRCSNSRSNDEQPEPPPAEEEGEGSSTEGDLSTKPKGRRKGYGLNGASEYDGAEKISVPHASLMSLIYTCELNSVNPFDYLTELEQHADELAAAPADWMP